MHKETEEAIQNIGNFCKNIGEGASSIMKIVLVIEFIVLGGFVLFVFVIPWVQCDILNEEWCNAIPLAAVEPHPRESIMCVFKIQENEEWEYEHRIFGYGWQEVETYLKLFPETKIIQCEGRFNLGLGDLNV